MHEGEKREAWFCLSLQASKVEELLRRLPLPLALARDAAAGEQICFGADFPERNGAGISGMGWKDPLKPLAVSSHSVCLAAECWELTWAKS